MKAADLDHLSDLFIECIHAQRKSLRQNLIKIKLNEKEQKSLAQTQGPGAPQNKANQSSLLNTYLKIVKTGAPHEID